jgi:hypothetical protein
MMTNDNLAFRHLALIFLEQATKVNAGMGEMSQGFDSIIREPL